MSFVSPSEASKFYQVTEETLRDWSKKNLIDFIKTKGGHRRYKIDTDDGKRIIYARVSSKKQEGDLKRQITYLQKTYPDYEVFSDIGSGLNFKRPKFKWILEQVFEGNVDEVVVSTADRFSRYGTEEFFRWIFSKFGATLTICRNTKSKSSNEELADDLLAIITVFTAKYHGQRSYSNAENSLLPDSESESDD